MIRCRVFREMKLILSICSLERADVTEESRIAQALCKMFRHDMITQGLLYHDFPDDQDNGRKSLVVPSIIRNPFTAEVSPLGVGVALRLRCWWRDCLAGSTGAGGLSLGAS